MTDTGYPSPKPDCMCGRWLCKRCEGRCHDCYPDDPKVIACKELGQQPEYAEALAFYEKECDKRGIPEVHTSPIFAIYTETSDLPFNEDEGNLDTMILGAPERWFMAGGHLNVMKATIEVHQLLSDASSLMGRVLHHAEFMVSNNPTVVSERGRLHDCTACKAGVDQVLAVLRDKPATRICVATMWLVP